MHYLWLSSVFVFVAAFASYSKAEAETSSLRANHSRSRVNLEAQYYHVDKSASIIQRFTTDIVLGTERFEVSS